MLLLVRGVGRALDVLLSVRIVHAGLAPDHRPVRRARVAPDVVRGVDEGPQVAREGRHVQNAGGLEQLARDGQVAVDLVEHGQARVGLERDARHPHTVRVPYGHVDVARSLIEQGAELAWADEADEADAPPRLLVDPSDVAAADIEAFSRACDDRDDLRDALLDSDSESDL